MIVEKTINNLSEKINKWTKEGRRVFVTSSFQTQSVPLLHLISRHCPSVIIVFIDTRFLFPETYSFKERLEKEFDLNIVEVQSATSLHLQTNENGLLQYCSNTDFCCHLNKVQPLDSWMEAGDIWISGVRRDQSSVRKAMEEIEERGNITRFHPMLDWTNKDIYNYIREKKLPKHPLENDGYISIGCVPCTYKWNGENLRGGRWLGQAKTECGLHTEIRKK